jgi:Tol biopolymer transport system component
VLIGEVRANDQLLALSHDARQALVGTPWRDPQRYALVDLVRETRRVLPGTAPYWPDGAWSQDDSLLAYVTEESIVILREGRLSRCVRLGQYDSATGGLAWSPDGRRLAFTATRESDLVPSDPDYDPFHNRAREAVIVVRADGRVLARTPNAARPAWSPNGQQLAFDSNRGGRRQIYVADANGRNARQVTHGPRASWRARWRRLR